MRTTVSIDAELEAELASVQNVTRESKNTVIRLALKAGLPLVVQCFQSPRPEGYFASDYERSDRKEFETKMAASLVQKPER
jgi:hypothetical protein